MNTIDEVVRWIESLDPKRIVAFTGAGVSAESGVPTFRGSGGLWKEYRAEDLATPEAFERDPRLVWEWYEWRRSAVRQCEVNAAHEALARLEVGVPDSVAFDLVTQNVDGLHERAGSRRIHELHGNMFRVRCVREGTKRPMADPPRSLPPCCECGSLLRPDVVWFGEPLPEKIFRESAIAARAADLFLVIGTSGVVYPAAGLVEIAPREATVIVNPDETPLDGYVHFSIRDTAARAVPPIVAAITGVRR